MPSQCLWPLDDSCGSRARALLALLASGLAGPACTSRTTCSRTSPGKTEPEPLPNKTVLKASAAQLNLFYFQILLTVRAEFLAVWTR